MLIEVFYQFHNHKIITTSLPIVSTDCNSSADFNNDCVVNFLDLGMLLSKWETNSPEYDLYKDNIINSLDLVLLLSEWGPVSVNYK